MVSFRHQLCLCFSDRSLSPSHRLLATICQSHESRVPRAPIKELNRHSRASMPAERRETRPWPDRSWGRCILWNPGKPQVVSVGPSPPCSQSGKWLVRAQAAFYGKLPQSPCGSVFCQKANSETSLTTLVNRESSESKRTSEAIASAVLLGWEDCQCAKWNGRNRAPPWSECSEYRTMYEPVGMDPGSISNKRKASCPIRCTGT